MVNAITQQLPHKGSCWGFLSLTLRYTLDGRLTYVRGPVTISSGEKLFLAANTDDIVYRIYGYDNRRL